MHQTIHPAARLGAGETILPPATTTFDTGLFDHPLIQGRYVEQLDEHRSAATLLLFGISCAGCAHAIEGVLAGLAGVTRGEVNFSTHRLRVEWLPKVVSLGDILQAIRARGYDAVPYDPLDRERNLQLENRAYLRRLGVAGALGMQVMMMTVALYAGAWQGMETQFKQLFGWLSLILCSVVLVYSGRAFFAGAIRDIRNRMPGMDVPITLGLSLAFAASFTATMAGHGETYYESIVMFVFLVLLARYLQFLARRRSLLKQEALSRSLPVTATLIGAGDGKPKLVPAQSLMPGDRVLVKPGEIVPADGLILVGATSVDESFLTGESRALLRLTGERVLGGSINTESPVEVEVTASPDDGRLSQILQLVDSAGSGKPRVARIAERVATFFVVGVLVLAGGVALYWWGAQSDRWLAITVSVLVVTCPCALSLAAPAAISTAIGNLARRGIIVTNADALEDLASATHFVFDKTGTLTEGRFSLQEVKLLHTKSREECLRIAAALERQSEHPLARALLHSAGDIDIAHAQSVVNTPGGGITGRVDGVDYLLGSMAFTRDKLGSRGCDTIKLPLGDDQTPVILACTDGTCLSMFLFTDTLREDARELIEHLRKDAKQVSIFSGDDEGVVRSIATRLGIDDANSRMTPEDKHSSVRILQALGERVAMVGDGLNDAPVLSAATVSIAMGVGSSASLANADILLTTNRLRDLIKALRIARLTRSVICQNFAWALLYNLLAIPVASLGLITPWMAALGMSLSSLVVVGNSLRLGSLGADGARTNSKRKCSVRASS